MSLVPEMELLKIQTLSLNETQGTFVIEPLLPGYGTTIGNALRRILLSSLPGAAFTTIRVNNATHEFTTIPGITEDLVNIIMNLKQIRIKLHGDEPAILKLSIKGPKLVTAKDFLTNPQVQVMTLDTPIATLDKKGQLTIEAKVERGRGYLPTEKRKEEKLPLGMIAIDAIFTPIRKVNFIIENTRVGQDTNFDKLTIEVTTDGTINPAQAIIESANILKEHFELVSTLEIPQIKTPAKPAKKSSTSAKAMAGKSKKPAKSKTKK